MYDEDGLVIQVPKRWFNDAYLPYLYATQYRQFLYGGASSGKSRFVAQRADLDLLSGDRNYLVARAVRNTIKSSIYSEFRAVVEEGNINHLFKCNDTDLSITCLKTGCQALFVGLDDPNRIKSIRPRRGVFTDLVLEEATEISEPAYNQLSLRLRGPSLVPKRHTFLFNPITKLHWICKRFFGGKDIDKFVGDEMLILRTTHKDNRFLSAQDHANIEALKETDEYFYNVYALGKWGTLGHTIFNRWSIEPLFDDEGYLRDDVPVDIVRHGVDFGYADDPAAYTRSSRDKKRKRLYVLNEVYLSGLTNPDLVDAIEPYCGKDIVRCDPAEPKSIRELKICGLSARPAKRKMGKTAFGTRSAVLYDIQWLQQHDVVIDAGCQNTANEFSLFQWQKDKHTGEALPVPVDKYDHSISSLRYAWSNDMVRGGSLKGLVTYTDDHAMHEDTNVDEQDEKRFLLRHRENEDDLDDVDDDEQPRQHSALIVGG